MLRDPWLRARPTPDLLLTAIAVAASLRTAVLLPPAFVTTTADHGWETIRIAAVSEYRG